MTTESRILIVDDQPSALYTMEMLLASEPYSIAYATNGEEALEAIRQCAPDLVLLDVMMPGMTGFEVSRRLKSDSRWQHIPIMLVTALDRKEDLVQGLESGADEFINKPVHGPELRARVRSLLRMKQMYDELQHTLEMREEMANMIIHDMRNPLASLLIFADLLTRVGDLPPRVAELQKRIRSQAHRLNDFFTDLLLLAKMQSGKLLLNEERVDLGALLEKVRQQQQVLADARQIALDLDIAPIDAEVSLDYKLFQRALDNLLSNAIKFSPSGSVVTLRLSRENGRVFIQVADEGPGIPTEYHESVFDKYEIAPVRDAGVSQVGLGLAYCKMVTDAHDGAIYVRDNQPCGAIFTIELPLSQKEPCLP